jgi:adenylate cyclase
VLLNRYAEAVVMGEEQVNNQRTMEQVVNPSQLATLLFHTRCEGFHAARAITDPSMRPAREETHPFLPGLVEYSLTQHEQPTRQEIAVLFVDLADSTRLVVREPAAHALAMMQRFLRIVTDVTLAYCGDVKDYEGDGALLYFGSVAQATNAALAIRAALMAGQAEADPALRARFSVNVGEVIVAVIGSSQRRSVALIGPAVSLAARLLKHIAPGSIIAPLTAVEKLRSEAPQIAAQFQVWEEDLFLKGFEEEPVRAAVIPAGNAEVGAETCLECHANLSASAVRSWNNGNKKRYPKGVGYGKHISCGDLGERSGHGDCAVHQAAGDGAGESEAGLRKI